MQRFQDIRRKAFGAGLLCAMGFALTGAAPASAGPDVISSHANWDTIAMTGSDNRAFCGVQTRLKGGASFTIFSDGSKIHLAAVNPGWRLPSEAHFTITAEVDGDGFAGTADVASRDMVLVRNLSAVFLDRFIRGDHMVFRFAGSRWAMKLNGSGKAAADMAHCLATGRSAALPEQLS